MADGVGAATGTTGVYTTPGCEAADASGRAPVVDGLLDEHCEAGHQVQVSEGPDLDHEQPDQLFFEPPAAREAPRPARRGINPVLSHRGFRPQLPLAPQSPAPRPVPRRHPVRPRGPRGLRSRVPPPQGAVRVLGGRAPRTAEDPGAPRGRAGRGTRSRRSPAAAPRRLERARRWPIDAKPVPSAGRLAERLVSHWPRLAGRVERRVGDLSAVDIGAGDLVVSVHACGALSDTVLDLAIGARAPSRSCPVVTTRPPATPAVCAVSCRCLSPSTPPGSRVCDRRATRF